MSSIKLSFSAVDDLIGAHEKRRLPSSPDNFDFAPTELGPLIELALYRSGLDRYGPLLETSWLNALGQRPLRDALSESVDEWFDLEGRQGFLRTVFDPLDDANTPVRTRFLMAAGRSAEQTAGLSKPVAQSLAAAIREMESNVYEHSNNSNSGVLAFHAEPGQFEFVVADQGVGVLETLREAPEHHHLKDHGVALQIALQEGASRYGIAANRGMGFKDLFVGLASLNADLRFRSGDHALTISGPHPTLKASQLSQKPFFPGFLISVRCSLPTSPNVPR
jgi:anti-sigma regulatory factor (Ser/Thr protein kinase)